VPPKDIPNGSISNSPVLYRGPEALIKLKENVENSRNGLHDVIKQVGGNMVNPLRQEWIMSANTDEEWKEAMKIIVSRRGY
jgi:hypothetical protein